MKGIIESRHKLEFMEAHNVDEPLLKLEDHMVAQTSSLLKGVYRRSSLIGDHLFFLWKMLVYAMGK